MPCFHKTSAHFPHTRLLDRARLQPTVFDSAVWPCGPIVRLSQPGDGKISQPCLLLTWQNAAAWLLHGNACLLPCNLFIVLYCIVYVRGKKSRCTG